MIDASEICDDGGNADCDGCRGDCSAVETGCGDGFHCGPEQCDDGAWNGSYGYCLADCSGEGTICGSAAQGSWGVAVVDSADSVGAYSAIAIGSDGLPVIAYRNATTGLVSVAHCGDPICSPLAATRTGIIAGSWISLAISADGYPVLAYQDANSTALGVAKCYSVDCLSGPNTRMVYDNGNTGKTTSISIGADGYPFVAFRSASGSACYSTKCSNAACTSATSTYNLAGGLGSNGLRLDGTIGADGNPVIAIHNTGTTALQVIKCSNSSCSSRSTFTVDNSASVGSSPSIVLAPDGYPLITYYDATSGNVKIVKCGNAACTSGNSINIVASAGNVGNYSSLALLSGLPVISYHDADAGRLMVAKCQSIDCGVAPALEVADASAAVGGWNAIAVDASDVIHVSYYQSSNADLRHACQGP